ncbi:urease subunit gamma [Streptomyces sp. 3N207]|uniref:urease subunit gamma n=1 Tax=Streptomyces sp. 3N207 TaxID=3457417 RepID=UPI003FD4E0FC
MHLIPSEQEKLLLSVAGMLASYRKERGIKLNYPEAVAYISCWVIEEARAGSYTVDQMMSDPSIPLDKRKGDTQGEGERVLTTDDVMEGVPEMLDILQIEATFPDGRKLVTLYDPIRAPIPAPSS